MVESFRRGTGVDVHHHIELGFDELAPSYEEDIGRNTIGVQMRDVFRKALVDAFPRPSYLFEIGCGTGIDAIWLAQQGMDVVATDISEEMVARVREKVKSQGLSERVRCRKLAAKDIGTLRTEFGETAFDGGFSHAGALNMEPDVARVPSEIRSLVKPGGRFVCSVINKTSLFEVLFYPLALRPRKAFRRLGNVVPIPISRRAPLNHFVVPTRFYSPADIVRLFRGALALESFQGVRIFLPPANLTDEYSRVRIAFLPLEALEGRISKLPPLRSWGHHTILTFQRV